MHAEGVDDVYISFRCGWNHANNNNLSWNESGYRRTEYFTDPLCMYKSAALSLLVRKDLVYPFGIRERGLRTWIALSIQRDMGRFDYGSPKSNDPLLILSQALEVERSRYGVYATFSFQDTNFISGPESISMWVDYRHLQDTVQRQVTQQQWDAAIASGDHFIWSIVSKPVYVSKK